MVASTTIAGSLKRLYARTRSWRRGAFVCSAFALAVALASAASGQQDGAAQTGSIVGAMADAEGQAVEVYRHLRKHHARR